MTTQEFSNEFDVLYNNAGNQAPGLDEYEKSVFLTKAQNEIIKNYFIPESNKIQKGFDDNQKRQIDFSNLMKTQSSISTIGDSGHINIAAIGSTGVVIVNVKDKATGNILDFNALTQGTYTLSNKTAYTSEAAYSSTTYVLTFNSDISELTGDLVISSNQVPINRIDSRIHIVSK